MGFSPNAVAKRIDGALDIPGYEGLYQVTSEGDVYSLLSGKKLKPGTAGRGYLKVALWKNKSKRDEFVHRLIALAWVCGDKSLTVNHKDGDKRNNRADNLEFVTLSENIGHSHKHLQRKRTLARNYVGGMEKLLELVEEWKSGKSMYAIAKQHGVSPGTFRDQLIALGEKQP